MVRKLDRYELIDVIGTGAFATVWRAHDPVLADDVAIKVLADNWSRDIEMRQRFLTEARNALKVTNEHLIRVHHVAESQDESNTPYIVMALADGGTLEERNRQRRLLAPDINDALRIIRDIAIAVAALHANGFLHRDLKPANILFQETPSGGQRLVLGDFGLARAIERSALTMVAGTPAYAAPEQAAGLTQLTPQADLYALGVMFLELVTGALPTANETMADTAVNHIDIAQALAPSKVQLDADTYALLEELLNPEPEARPTSAHAVVQRINALLGDDDHVPYAPPTALSEPPGPSPLAQRTAAAVAATQLPSDTPTQAVTTSSSLPAGPIIGAVVAGVIGLVIIGVLLLGGGGADAEQATDTVPIESIETTTTDAPQPETTTTAAPTTAAAPQLVEQDEPAENTERATVEFIPSDFPIPGAAVQDASRSNGDLLRIYNIAGTPEDLLNQYEAFSAWTVDNVTIEGAQTIYEVFNDLDRLTITSELVPNTTGVNVTVFSVEPTQP